MTTAHPPLVANRYRLIKPLGQGGMGRVWRARDEVLRRDVAIKELVPPPNLTAEERREMRERLLREARAIARLNHPNVVRIFDVLRTDGDPWIVMEYVPSRSLQDVLAKDGPIDPVQAARIGLAVLSALRAAHRAGVMHRDVKPANVLLGENGRVVLTDFGLATVSGDPAVTRTGLVLGSPAYLAPERARTGVAGPEADMWSLGATLYAAVEGRSPYARPSALATLAALATEPVPPAKNAGPLKPVLNGLLRKDPAARISAEEAERLLRRAAGKRTRGAKSLLIDGVRRSSGPSGTRGLVPVPRPPAEHAGAPMSPPPIAVLVAPPPKRTLERPASTGERSRGEAHEPTPAGVAATAGAGAGEAGPAGAERQASAPRAEAPTLSPPRAEAPMPPPRPVVAATSPPAARRRVGARATAVLLAVLHSTLALLSRLVGAASRSAPRARTLVVSSVGAARAWWAAARPRLVRAWAGLVTAGRRGGAAARSRLAALEAAISGIPWPQLSWFRLPRARLRAVRASWARRLGEARARVVRASALGRRGPWLIAAVTCVAAVVTAALVFSDRSSRSEARHEVFSAPSQPPTDAAAPLVSTDLAASPSAARPTSSPTTATPSPSASGFVLPAGWIMYTDRTGFSVPIQRGWQVSRDSSGRVQFRDLRKGRMLMIDQTDTPQPDPVADWKSKEDYRRRTEPQYQRVGQIRAVDYGLKAADWEWLYTAPGGVRMHVRNRGFIAAKDKAYAIYWETPESIWTESLADFEVIAAGFRPVRGKAA